MFKKVVDFTKKNFYSILYVITIVIFFLINFLDLRHKLSNNAYLTKYCIIFIFLSLFFSILIYFICRKKKKFNDENIPKIFVWVAIILGAIYLGLSPLFTGSDEHNHYFRIYEISDGVLVTPTNKVVGSKLPKSLSDTFLKGSANNTTIKYKNAKGMLAIDLNKYDKIQYGDLWTNAYNNTALYSPIQYIPQVIGFSIAKSLNFGPYLIGIFGRIFNLIFYIILGYFCLKQIPKAKLFYLLILLSPNMLQCATTLSADALTNTIFLLFIALIFKTQYNTNKLDTRNKMLLLILSITISLCKIVYMPIVFLLFLINSDKYKNGKKEKIVFNIITILLSVIVSFLWMAYTNDTFEIAYDQTKLQKQFIFTHLINYIIIFVRTYVNYLVKYIECLFVGTTMYHSQLHMPSIISFAYVIIVLLSLLGDKIKNNLNIIKRWIVGIVSIAIVGLISTAIYIQCTAQYYSIGNLTIEGIQGRYFIPIIFLIPFIFKFKYIRCNNKLLFISALIINLISWFYMLNQFII